MATRVEKAKRAWNAYYFSAERPRTVLFGAAETHGISERNNLGSVFTVLFLQVKDESTVNKLCK